MNKTSIKFTLPALIFLLWATLIIALYYVLHRPWQPGEPFPPLAAVMDLLIAASLLSLAGGVGRRVSGALQGISPLERIAFHAALGLGLLATGFLVLGMLGWLYPWLLTALLVLALLLFSRDIAAWMRDWRSFSHLEHKSSLLERLLLCFVIFVVVLNLLKAFAPPLKWDSLVYHLELPKQYLAAGRVFFVSENLYGGFPQIAEMLFTWVMAVGAPNTAVVLGWGVGVVALVGVEGFARRTVGGKTAWLAPAVLLSGYSISGALSWAYVELWVMLFGLAIVLALDMHRIAGNRRWLLYAGALSGFAIGVKYTAGMLFLIGIITLLPFWDRLIGRRFETGVKPLLSERLKQIAVDILIFSGMAALFAIPWVLKNWILAGHPFYPLSFSSAVIDPWRQVFSSFPVAPRSLLDDLLLPLEATIYGLEDAAVSGRPPYGASIGPLLLALIPGLAVGWKRIPTENRSRLLYLALIAGLLWVFWALMAHFVNELVPTRFYYGFFPVLAVLAVAGFDAVSEVNWGQVRIQRVLAVLVGLALGISALSELSIYSQVNPLPVLFGHTTQDEFQRENLGEYALAIQALNELPPDSIVLFLFEPRVFDCQVECLPDCTLHNWWYLRQVYADAEQIGNALRIKGISHVLIYEAGVEWLIDGRSNYQSADWDELDNFRMGQLDLVMAFEKYSIYQLIDEPSSTP